MFLKSLTLKGFKSFAETATLEFEPGVTVVVGPNGSGKSNLVDAVAWVLGAQGPRMLRSGKMEDVIFAGTPKRAPLGRAEVELTIDNSAGLLPIDFSEVTITRTLFRSGESEYAINGVPCRLLDMQELLSDTGVGRQQHVIVSQGQLDSVLNARPEDRRLIIEEAAGILKFRRRKEKAERRLESTENTLVRLQDLLREVRRQLRPLERQAEAAKRHGDVSDELHAIRRYQASRELASLEGRTAKARQSRSDLARSEEEVRAALNRLDTDVLVAEGQLTALQNQARHADLGDAVSRAEALRARARGLESVLAERRRSIERERLAAIDHDVVANLEAEAARAAAELVVVDEEASRLLPVADEVSEAEGDLAAAMDEFEAQWRDKGPGAAERASAVGLASQLRGELSGLGAARDRARNDLRRLDGQMESNGRRQSRLRQELERLTGVVAESDRGEPALLASLERARRLGEQTQIALDQADAACRAAEADEHRWAARSDALASALDESRARAGAERLADVEGVVGTLLELVEVDEGWEAAFEAAAGESIAAVVVDGPDAARRSLARLRELEVGGAVLALPAVAGDAAPSTGQPGLRSMPPGAEPIRSHVQTRVPAVGALLDELLSRAVAVPGDWVQALDAVVTHPGLTVVTRAGDRFSPSAWRAGAASGGPSASLVALERATSHTAQAAEEVRRCSGVRVEAKAAADLADRQLSELTRRLDSVRAERAAAANTAERTERDLRDANAEAEVEGHHRQELAERLFRDDARIAELEATLPELERVAEVEAERALAERAGRAQLSERQAAVAALRRDLEVRAAGLEERRGLLTRRLVELEDRLRRHEAEREQAALIRLRLTQAATATERLAAGVEQRAAQLDQYVAELRAARQKEGESVKIFTDRLDQLRRERSTTERQLSEIRERTSRLELEDAELRVRLETLVESIRRELDCEPDAIRGIATGQSGSPNLPPGTSPTGRIRELERELRLMGPINPLALEEYTALQERHLFLEGQLEDVRSARRELTKVIRAVDAEIVVVFRAAYADVADNFERLFATLFPGGQGRLRLTEPDHLLETGIDVEARPSGKNVRRLSLLSGGERSLVALAFLFAVFRSRPSPFYLLDEVEAALDDVNLHRFLDLVHEFREEAQLLVVSHQKRTMEAADCLYGVTMQPGGSSKVVSERVTIPS